MGEPQVVAMLGIDNVTLALAPLPSLLADFNDDGRVDADDLTLWEGEFGTGAGADANEDGLSDGADFLVWQTEFGAGSPPTGTAVAAGPVPEPTVGVCIALAAAPFALNSRRRPRL